MPQDHYATLGLTASATDADIKRAYKRLTRLHHPDKAGTTQANTSELLTAIRAAYAVLSDPVARKQYDVNRAHVQQGGGELLSWMRKRQGAGKGKGKTTGIQETLYDDTQARKWDSVDLRARAGGAYVGTAPGEEVAYNLDELLF